MLVIWQVLVPLPNSHTWERRNGQTRGSTSTITWLYRGSLLCLPSEAAHLSAHFTVSLPQHPGMLLCETLSQQPHSSVVQSQRMHRDELIKRSSRSICLSLDPHLVPASEMQQPHCENMSMSHRLSDLPQTCTLGISHACTFYQSFTWGLRI